MVAFTVVPTRLSSESFQAGEKVICKAFALDIKRSELAPEAAFDPKAPCGRAGFWLDCSVNIRGPDEQLVFPDRPCVATTRPPPAHP